jgi:hypothetical protein
MNFFMEDFGADLARMPAFLPDREEKEFFDPAKLRWSVRSDGVSGFLFVNNYQRLQRTPAKTNTNFRIDLPGRSFTLPAKATTIPSDSFFYWPFNLELNGVKLLYATAQPVRRIKDADGGLTVVFAEIPGVPAEFVFDSATLLRPLSPDPLVFRGVRPSRESAFRVAGKSGKEVRVILLSETDSLALTPELNASGLVFDRVAEQKVAPVVLELLKNPGALRDWKSRNPEFSLPVSPGINDFQSAAVWKVKLPENLDMASNPILRIHYVGDVARLTLNGRLLNDDFYNGMVFEIGLRRYAPEILSGELFLEILPLQKSMPVYFEPDSRPSFASDGTALRIERAEIQYTEQKIPKRLASNVPLEPLVWESGGE